MDWVTILPTCLAHYDLVVPRDSILNKYSLEVEVNMDENGVREEQITETGTIPKDEFENLQDMLVHSKRTYR